MRKFINLFSDMTGFAWVLILGFAASLFFATRIVAGLWGIESVSFVLCVLIWMTIAIAGFIVSFTLAYIYHKLFEQ